MFRYSELFFKDRPDQSLSALNEGRRIPLEVGDYEFSWSFAGGEPISKRAEPQAEPPGFQFLRALSHFRAGVRIGDGRRLLSSLEGIRPVRRRDPERGFQRRGDVSRSRRRRSWARRPRRLRTRTARRRSSG